MVNVWIFLIFLIPHVECLIPMNSEGIPLPLETIRDKYVPGNQDAAIKVAAEYEIWKLGMDVMKQYCQYLTDEKSQQFVAACPKVVEIYNREFGPSHYKYIVEGNNFPSRRIIEGYLGFVEGENTLETISENLKRAIVHTGWAEIKEFCNEYRKNVLNRKYKKACKFAQDITFTALAQWYFDLQRQHASTSSTSQS